MWEPEINDRLNICNQGNARNSKNHRFIIIIIIILGFLKKKKKLQKRTRNNNGSKIYQLIGTEKTVPLRITTAWLGLRYVNTPADNVTLPTSQMSYTNRTSYSTHKQVNENCCPPNPFRLLRIDNFSPCIILPPSLHIHCIVLSTLHYVITYEKSY